MMMLGTAVAAAVLGAQCGVPDNEKVDCGHIGTNEQQCEASGCCWSPGGSGSQTPWCYFPAGMEACGTLLMEAEGPGFPASFVSEMERNFAANLNIDGSGGVVAAPDRNVNGGGSYYFNWMRDAGLSTRAYMRTQNGSYAAVAGVMGAYVRWVAGRQVESDPNGVNVLVEPKFNVPAGTPFTGGWCRPQTDGPALRAHSLTEWGTILLDSGRGEEARNTVLPLILKDLDWVAANWGSNGCDLWEEVQSTDFFWNRMAFVRSLTDAAALLGRLGEGQKAGAYRAVAEQVRGTLGQHWNGNYYFEATGREVDGAVIHAIVSFGGNDTELGPLSDRAASTAGFFEEVFCAQYPINNADTKNGVPGVLIGRYPGDKYGGGNPWQLLSAALAELYYKVAEGASSAATTTTNPTEPFRSDDGTLLGWRRKLQAGSPAELAAKAKASGDSIMTRLHYHVQGNGVVYEQIDKNDGFQKSAFGLTWSYANLLSALHMRKQL